HASASGNRPTPSRRPNQGATRHAAHNQGDTSARAFRGPTQEFPGNGPPMLAATTRPAARIHRDTPAPALHRTNLCPRTSGGTPLNRDRPAVPSRSASDEPSPGRKPSVRQTTTQRDAAAARSP